MTAPLIGQIGNLLKSGIPAVTALTGISKVNPRLKRFITSSLTAGYGADQVIDYIRDLNTPVEERRRLSDLSKRASSGAARPDELESLQKQTSQHTPFKLAKGAAAIAGGLLGANEQELEPEIKEGTFFERFLGAEDIPDHAAKSIFRLKERLDNLEQRGTDFKSETVQTLGNAIRKLLKRKPGVVEREAERFEQGHPQQAPTQSSSKQKLMETLQRLSGEFKL